MSPRRTALLGFGHVAEHGHLPAWRERSDFTIVAVADPDAARRDAARRLLPHAEVFEDPIAALSGQRIDVVDIAAPPALHAPIALRAIEKGCHVLCEKPLVTTLADCRTLADAARSEDIALFTVHNWKHSEQFRKLAAVLADGSIGRPSHLRLETIRAGRAVSVGSEWRGDAALAGGGILFDHGWHALYLLLSLAAETPRQLRAVVERRRYTTADVEDTVICEIEFPSLRGEIFLTWAGDVRQTRWHVHGNAGSATLIDDHGELKIGGERHALRFDRSLSAGSHHPDWFGAVIDEFVAEIDDPSRRGRNLAEAEQCMALTALAYESGAHAGRVLPIPQATNSPQRAQRFAVEPSEPLRPLR